MDLAWFYGLRKLVEQCSDFQTGDAIGIPGGLLDNNRYF